VGRGYHHSFTFNDLVGQEHVVQALVNGLDQDRVHHAFLLTGTRGVGKTTIARILAKCLNCEQGVSSTPCGECGSCIDLDDGRFVDMLEIDAASKTKVDDTRELLETVQYTPTRGRYKVYIIDEVHMLSGHSFNALLKTLEEPPPHVKFVLATTDPQAFAGSDWSAAGKNSAVRINRGGRVRRNEDRTCG
jgi:DNA polymerase-3 subunit gamma/tau